MLPPVESRLRAVVWTVPVAALVRSLADVRLTLVNGVLALPIAAPMLSPPAVAFSSTEPDVLFASIVAVVANVVALVATKLKSVPADDAPLIVTVPVALSDMLALPLALAVMLATEVVKVVPGVVP